jgi:hypothetical protein
MIYDFWYRLSRTIFPFISLKRYNEICDDYDAMLNEQFNCIESQAGQIRDLHNKLDAMWYPVSSCDGIVISVDLPATVESFEPIAGKSVEAGGVFYATLTDEEDIARMDNEGPVNPAQWKKD